MINNNSFRCRGSNAKRIGQRRNQYLEDKQVNCVESTTQMPFQGRGWTWHGENLKDFFFHSKVVDTTCIIREELQNYSWKKDKRYQKIVFFLYTKKQHINIVFVVVLLFCDPVLISSIIIFSHDSLAPNHMIMCQLCEVTTCLMSPREKKGE